VSICKRGPFRVRFSFCSLLFAGLLASGPAVSMGQEVQADSAGQTGAVAAATEPRNPREMRLSLWDGSIMSGDIGTSNLHVKTQFGMLEVPVSSIVIMRPGLDSLTGLRQEIEVLVEELGDRDFKKREQAVQRISQMGPMWRDYLAGLNDGGSAERKKHLQHLVAQFSDDLENQLDGFGAEGGPQSLGKHDTITTKEFTIVGSVQEQDFDITTRFGMLRVQLADIQSADRQWMLDSVTIRKSVDVSATGFFQTQPAGTGIRVRKGDRISIRATGSVQWTSWGNLASGPEGITNHGQWNAMNCGMLAARIGKSDEYIPVGADHDFVAAQDGELILGIAMQDNYAAQQGYQWNGDYKAKVVVVSGNPE